MIEHCFHEKEKNTLLLSDASETESSIAYSLFESFTPVTLFATDKNDVFKEHKRVRKVYGYNETNTERINRPSTSVIFEVSSNETLAMTLDDMKKSVCWNHESHFLLVNRNFNNGT